MSGSISGAPNLTVIDAITQFVGGTQAIWNDITIPVPQGLIIYAVDTTVVKIGDGITLYVNLPVVITLNTVLTQLSQLSNELTINDVNQAISTALTNSPALGGTPTAPTPTTGDNSTNISTTAFVTNAISIAALAGSAGITETQLQSFITTALSNYVTTTMLATSLSGINGTITPLMDGTATVGSSVKYAHEDHVHPTDTSRAPLNSPAFTGTPTAPTQSAGDNSTNIATTAYADQAISTAQLQISEVSGNIPVQATNIPLMDGTAAIGASTKYATEDHIHPTDTTRAPINSPAFTGTPTAPTHTANDNSTNIATTAYTDQAISSVELQITSLSGTIPGEAVASPLMDGTAAVGASAKYAREDHIHPADTSRAPVNSPAFTGTPTAPTQTPGDNSTKLATTAYTDLAVLAVEATATPLMDGTAAVGGSVKYAREDHVHPSDTTRAAIWSIRNRTNGNVTLYVNTTSGSDTTGDGSSANPLATSLQAQKVLMNNYDLTWGQATINVDGTTLTTVSQGGGMRYGFSTDSLPSSDIMLLPGDQCMITVDNYGSVPLHIATDVGLYRMTVIIYSNNSGNTDAILLPNNNSYTASFFATGMSSTGGLIVDPLPVDGSGQIFQAAIPNTSSVYPNQVSPLPQVQTSLEGGFLIDTFAGPWAGDTQNDIGPMIQRWDISTYTASKQVLVASGDRGGISLVTSRWLDTTTTWSTLGTYEILNGGTTLSGTIVIERLA